MPDWTASMQRTYEYYVVDPVSWKDTTKIDNVKKCTISRDGEAETLGSATINVVDSLGECYIRAYLITIQNGVREKFPLGTYLVQTPSISFNGRVKSVSSDAYSPLIELKEKPIPLGYSIPKKSNVMEYTYKLTSENLRAPVVEIENSETLYSDFVANSDDTWLSFNADLMANAKYQYDLDEMGRVLFAPYQEIEAMRPVWEYNDDNSSILYPDISLEHDIYGIPNVVEVIYSNGADYYYSRVVNDDENSPISTINRGREIVNRVTDPEITGTPNAEQVKEYAKKLLKSLSSIEYTVSYKHAYCPVRVGDCVRLNYERAGITGIKAKVISQTIECSPGCPVTEKAVFTTKLWGGDNKWSCLTI